MGTGFAQDTDPGLLRQARHGDMDAHGALYRQYSVPVYTLALRMLGRVDLAEEVVQDTFVELIHALPEYRGEAPFGSWLKRIAASKALMRLRRERGSPVVAAAATDDGEIDWPDPAMLDQGERAQRLAEIDAALGRLPAVGRAVLWLHDVEGWTHREIAVAMQRTTSFSKSQLSRARARMRQLLEASRCERISETG